MKLFNNRKLKKELKVSIILPNYNSSKTIVDTINSILLQTYKNWELIIVDDCSDKKTKNILSKYKNIKKIKIFYLKKNKGTAYCRNLAIKKSKSYYLAFIDSDDTWEKNYDALERYTKGPGKGDPNTCHHRYQDPETKLNVGQWLQNQRSTKKSLDNPDSKGKKKKHRVLTPERIKRLEKLGVRWNLKDYDEIWEKNQLRFL